MIFRPSPHLLIATSGVALAGLLLGGFRLFDVYTMRLRGVDASTESIEGSWLELLEQGWLLMAVLLLLLAVWDLVSGRPRFALKKARRSLPGSFALNRTQTIGFEIKNESGWAVHCSFSDALPENFDATAPLLEQLIQTDSYGVFDYQVHPIKRGEARLQAGYLVADTRSRLWQIVERVGGEDEVRVYPDFTAISNSVLFGVDQAMRNMGAHVATRKGEGLEFNQLREFRLGDTLKQIDWKATARVGEPISREYQEEKDQNIVFLLDCSRRMRAVEGQLSYFDHALNALLMTSYIALDKGDAVGVMSFSGESSWMPPVKGKASVNQILNHLYTLHTSTQSSDYIEAAEQLLARHRKRSLVVFITNVRDEDNEDLQNAVHLLSKNHLVMVVALQEALLNSEGQLDLNSASELNLWVGIKQFKLARNKMLARLKASGVSVVDATHENIHTQLASEYLLLKRRGRI